MTGSKGSNYWTNTPRIFATEEEAKRVWGGFKGKHRMWGEQDPKEYEENVEIVEVTILFKNSRVQSVYLDIE
jgi:hypothetical protein